LQGDFAIGVCVADLDGLHGSGCKGLDGYLHDKRKHWGDKRGTGQRVKVVNDRVHWFGLD